MLAPPAQQNKSSNFMNFKVKFVVLTLSLNAKFIPDHALSQGKNRRKNAFASKKLIKIPQK